MSRLQGKSKGRDPEFFLPVNSPLRTDKGELRKPAIKPGTNFPGPFENYEAFHDTLETRYWLQEFLEGHHDPQLSDLALKLVTDICTEQTKHDLRDKQSSTFGKFLGTSEKREHIVPLTLVLHEIKLWLVNTLRVANPTEQSAMVEVSRRILYIAGLLPRDIWANNKMLVMRQGIKTNSYERLSGLLQRILAALQTCETRVFRIYTQRRTHEKLGWLNHLARNCVMNSFKLISSICTFEYKLADTNETFRASDYLLESMKNHAKDSDWTNMANVMIRGLCLSRGHVGRLAILNDFTSKIHGPPTVEEVKDFGNCFCDKKSVKVNSEPFFFEDRDYYKMPLFYSEAYSLVLQELRTCTDSIKLYVTSKSTQASSWKRNFPGMLGKVEDRTRAFHVVEKYFAALEDTVYSFFALHELWTCAMTSNENMVMECLNPQLMRGVGDVIYKFSVLQSAEMYCVKQFTELGAKTLADQGKMSEAAQLLANGPGEPRVVGVNVKYAGSFYFQPPKDPIWISNLDYVVTDVLPINRNSYVALYKHAQEIAKDVLDYEVNFKNDEALMNFGARESNCVKIIDACQSPIRASDFTSGFFNIRRIIETRGLDWLNLGSVAMGTMEDVTNSAFTDETEIALHKTKVEKAVNIILANLTDNPEKTDKADMKLPDLDQNDELLNVVQTGLLKKDVTTRLLPANSSEEVVGSGSTTKTKKSGFFFKRKKEAV